MLPQNYSLEQSQNAISSALKELKVAKLLHSSNIRKGCGIPVFGVFQRLVMLVFYGKNLFRVLESKHNDHAVSKNTFYRFFDNPSFNWKRFQLAKIAMDKNASHLYQSLLVRTKNHNIPVRIVFVRNRNKRSEFLYILTTDTALLDDEIIRIYDMLYGK